MLEVALVFLRAYWKQLAVGAVILAILSYVGVLRLERNHYRSAAEDAKLKLETLVKASNAREAAMKADADAITAKYAASRTDATTLAIEAARLSQEKIKSDKELAATRITLNAVRMFNASKPTGAVEAPASETVSGNAREAGPAAPAPSGNEVSAFTLQDLLAQSARNDEEHLKCIAQVEAWQGFWRDFVNSVQRR